MRLPVAAKPKTPRVHRASFSPSGGVIASSLPASGHINPKVFDVVSFALAAFFLININLAET